jgi:hypothetical protein
MLLQVSTRIAVELQPDGSENLDGYRRFYSYDPSSFKLVVLSLDLESNNNSIIIIITIFSPFL